MPISDDYVKGHAEGHAAGYAEGYNDGYEDARRGIVDSWIGKATGSM